MRTRARTAHLAAALSAAAVAIAAPAASASAVVDPASGHSYEYVASPLTWPAAKAAAEARSSNGVAGHLATITSAAENGFVATAFGISTVELAWLGGFQPDGSPEPGGNWQWVTGEPFSYTNWAAGEPNDDPGNVDGQESKLAMYFNHPLFGNGTWNDHNTNSAHPYVVEYDTASVLQVRIDIKPGSSENPINPKSNGKTPVAILSSPGFDAPSAVNRRSLTFGRTGSEASLAFCSGAEDVNRDGRPDLICQFNTSATGFRTGDTKGILNGATVAGTPISGVDSVRIVR